MENKEKLYSDLGRLTFEKLDALAQSDDENAPELDFFLADGKVLELLNQISSSGDNESLPAPVSLPYPETGNRQQSNNPNSLHELIASVNEPLGAPAQTQAQSPAQQPAAKYCPYCAKELRPGAVFCLGCGNKI